MSIEFELKYRADAGQMAAVRAVYSGNSRIIAMETTYYDTPSGILSARHITCRKRLENGTAVCTVKTPAPKGARGEWETECDSIEKAIPDLCKLGCPKEVLSLTKEGLRPICGARFTRTALDISFPGGRAELALDSGALTGGGKEMPLCEIEIELKSGEIGALLTFGEAFSAEFGLEPQPKSKFRRAFDLAKGD